jgi:hypothetical protein
MLSAGATRAAASCTGPEVRLEGQLDARWQDAARELPARLAQFPGLDPCSTVRLFERSQRLFVQVELSDGRVARRYLEQGDEPLAIVAALVTPLAGPEPAPPAPPGTQAAQVVDAERPPIASSSAIEADAPPHVTLELGLGPSLRLAGTPRYFGYGLTAYFGVSVDRWLIGVWARYDIRDLALEQEDLPGDLDMASVLIGVNLGYRVLLAQSALDLLLGPNVLFENQEARSADGQGEVGGVFADMSLALMARWLAPRRGAFHFFAQLSGEIYPLRAADRVVRAPELPALPTFAGTLALGAAWSSR